MLGFLSHLHCLMVTMSQKSSVPQATKSVSQALMPDTSPFSNRNLDVQSPNISVNRLLDVIANLDVSHSGGFFDHHGDTIPW